MMKYIILIFVFFFSVNSFAQESLKVTYNLSYKRTLSNNNFSQAKFFLYANSEKSLFIEDILVNKLELDYELLNNNLSKVPKVDYWIFKDSDKTLHAEKFKGEQFVVLEFDNMKITDWSVTNDTATIASLVCFKAQTKLGNRNWTAWFTPEIPISEGPYKFAGLPGLILQINSDDEEFHFNTQKIEEFKGKVTPPPYTKVSAQKRNELKLQKIEDPLEIDKSIKVTRKYNGKEVSNEEWADIVRKALLDINHIEKD